MSESQTAVALDTYSLDSEASPETAKPASVTWGAASVGPGSLSSTSDLVNLDAAGEVPGIEALR